MLCSAVRSFAQPAVGQLGSASFHGAGSEQHLTHLRTAQSRAETPCTCPGTASGRPLAQSKVCRSCSCPDIHPVRTSIPAPDSSTRISSESPSRSSSQLGSLRVPIGMSSFRWVFCAGGLNSLCLTSPCSSLSRRWCGAPPLWCPLWALWPPLPLQGSDSPCSA